MPEGEIRLDGGGVLPDGGPFPTGYRFRVSLSDDPAGDLEVWVEDGQLHVAGQYQPLIPQWREANHIAMRSVPLPEWAGRYRQ